MSLLYRKPVEEDLVEVVKDLIGITPGLPLVVFLGATNWEETPEKTQNMLEGLYIPSGLGKPWDAAGITGKSLKLYQPLHTEGYWICCTCPRVAWHVQVEHQVTTIICWPQCSGSFGRTRKCQKIFEIYQNLTKLQKH